MASTFFSICQQISTSTYKLTLSFSTKGVHTVFHVSFLHKHELDLIMEQQYPEPKHVEFNRKEEWEFKDILN